MQEVMFSINIPSLLLLGYLIAALLLYLGMKETEKPHLKYKYLWTGINLLGVMCIVTPFSWYGYWVAIHGYVQMTISDLFVLTAFSIVGGRIFGYTQTLQHD